MTEPLTNNIMLHDFFIKYLLQIIRAEKIKSPKLGGTLKLMPYYIVVKVGKLFFSFLCLFLFCYQCQAFQNTRDNAMLVSQLETSNLVLDWEKGAVNPSNWAIKVGGTKETPIWYNFIDSTSTGIINFRHFNIEGQLGENELIFNHCSASASIASGEKGCICAYASDSLIITQVFTPSSFPYQFDVSITLTNNGSKPFYPSSESVLKWKLGPGFGKYEAEPQPRSMYYYVEPIFLQNNAIHKYSAADTLTTKVLTTEETNLEWGGLHSHYFALLVLPPFSDKEKGTLSFLKTEVDYGMFNRNNSTLAHDLPLLSFYLPFSSVEQQQSIEWNFSIFSGPKSFQVLNSSSHNLKPLLFSDLWTWMRWLCLGLYHLLAAIHYIIPSWGWAIIFLALVVRLLLYPLGIKAQKSQKRFIESQKLMRPELIKIKETYKGGEQSEKILQLYKKYNVSPFAGLKPLIVVLVQLPILIALFHVLGNVFELRDASFLWIETLAQPDKLFSFGIDIPILGEYFNLLPFLMAGVTLMTFKLSPAPTVDKKEKKSQNFFLLLMTVIFFFLFYSFPAGMVLYWTFANVFQIVQQKLLSA